MPDTAKKRLLTGERTEEVEAIIERMPMRFSLFVTGIVILLAALLAVFGWIVKYPDVVKGQISISGRQSPTKLVCNSPGKLDLLGHVEGDSVRTGQFIAVIRNPAVTADVRKIDSLLNTVDLHRLTYANRRTFPEGVALGDLNSKYYLFINALYSYLDYNHDRPYDKQIGITEQLVKSQLDILAQEGEQSRILAKKYEVASRSFARDSNLYVNDVIAASDIDKSQLQEVGYEQEYKAIAKDVTADQYQLEDARGKIQQIAIDRTQKERELVVDLLNTYFDLKQAIAAWEKNFVFVAPFAGRLDFLGFWKEDDFVNANKEVFAVIPGRNEIYGQVYLPEAGAGKVELGQEVIVKLDGSPYQQFGVMKGEVKNISYLTDEQTDAATQTKTQNFLVTVSLPDGLQTNYGKSLNFYYDAKGSAEIIVKKRRLFERLFDNLRYSTRKK